MSPQNKSIDEIVHSVTFDHCTAVFFSSIVSNGVIYLH